jgi:hypothetical protein
MPGYSMDKHIVKPVIHSFKEFADSQPATRIWCVQHLTIDGDGSELMEAIKNNEAAMVSDGSFKDQRGTAALALQGATHAGEAQTVNRVPGEPDDTPWMISIVDKKLVRKLKGQIYSHVHLPDLKLLAQKGKVYRRDH